MASPSCQPRRISYASMSARGHFRQIDPLPTFAACPLRSDRVRTFAPRRIDAGCQQLTLPQVTKLLGSLYENLPHARSLTHHISVLPSTRIPDDANQPQ